MSYVIRTAQTPDDYAAFAVLIREYFEWMFDRYGELRPFIEAVGGHQGIERELDHLSGTFGPPAGKTLIAWAGDAAIGCVAYKDLHDGSAEMKRLFVPEAHQGVGLGRQLATEIVQLARRDGFERMRLDTGFLHDEAMRMYESMGFRPCDPYIDYPPDLMPHLRFYELSL
jgi:GNAT superfamily N-acetyltransferase